jgi:hypothetical protein
MAKIDPNLLIAVIQDVAIPEIMDFVRKYILKTGSAPTDDEVKAELQKNTQKYIDQGQAWLDVHPIN